MLANFKVPIVAVLLALGYIGQQLVWFEGDVTANVADQRFFNIFVANVLFALAIAFDGLSNTSGVLKTIGVFFLFQNIEGAVCALPPAPSSSWYSQNQRRAAYVGGVLVLISTFLGFALSLLKLITIPSGLGGRIASVRGITFLIAAATSFVTSFIAFSYKYTCPSTSSNPLTEAQANAGPIIIGFVILSAVLVGDGESLNLSVFLSSYGVLYWTPIFSRYITWSAEGQDSWFHKWRAQESIAFAGYTVLLLGVVADKFLKGSKAVAVKFPQIVVDGVLLGLAIAGAVCVYSRNPRNGEGSYAQRKENYYVSYAIVITVFNLLSSVLNLPGLALISTFFAGFVLQIYDWGSSPSYTGYHRGGLQLCQAATLLSVGVKVFPWEYLVGGDMAKLTNDKSNLPAAFFFLIWALIGAIRVHTNYSVFFLFAVICFGGVGKKDGNWSRVSFYLTAYWGIVGYFPLAVSISYDYLLALIHVAACAFAAWFSFVANAPTAEAFGETSAENEVAKVPA